MHFSSHAPFFILFSFSLPSKLPCGACWHGISQPSTQSPLVLSVLELERGRVRVPACVRLCVCHVLMHAYMWILGMLRSLIFPSYPFSHTDIKLLVIPQSHWQERGRGFLQKVHLVSWQHLNYKIAKTFCIGRIILKLKFHFVLAQSNGQNCLSEISKGQRELKCLL